MEKNIHDDQFDDYVKGAFDEYEEMPTSNMWNRIEKELEPEKRKRRPFFWWWAEHGRRVAATVAIVLLAAGMVGEYFYYEAKLQQAAHNSTQNNNNSATKDLTYTPPKNKESIVALPENQPNIASNNSGGGRKADLPKVNYPQINSPSKDFSIPTILPAITPLQAPELAFDAIKKQPDIDPLYLLPILKPAVLTVNRNIPLSYIQTEIKAVEKAKSKWYIGVYTTPARFSDKKTFRPPSGGRRYASLTERAEPIIELGARAGSAFGQSRLGCELGLSYRVISRNGTHFPRFRFSDGVFRPGLPARNYDFSYGLDTYGGTAEVTVRMEQIDNNPNVNANEAVSLRVFTREKVQVVRVPVQLTAQLGHGKLTARIKAGLVGNFILKNEINFTARISTSNRFRVGQTFTVQKSDDNRFIPGYQVSAGIHWVFTPQWSLVVEPTLAGDLSRDNNLQTKLPGLMSYGLNFGVNRSF